MESNEDKETPGKYQRKASFGVNWSGQTIQCIHKSTMTVQSGHDQQSPISIVNHPCNHTGTSLFKLVEIRTHQGTYFIEDTFQIQPQNRPQLQRHPIIADQPSLTRKRTVLLKSTPKSYHCLQKNDHQFGRTKNIVKNFVKAFLQHLEVSKREETDNRSDCLTLLRGLIESSHFNNVLIRRIISNEPLREGFRQFLYNHARQWIQQSRIKDKEIHYQALRVYLQLCGPVMHMVEDDYRMFRCHFEELSDSIFRQLID